MLRAMIAVLTLVLVLGPVAATPAALRAAQSATPTPAPGFDEVVALVMDGGHTLALRDDGTVWGWGTNSDWELGVTTPSGPRGSSTPVQAAGIDQVRSIATGSDHGLALQADGTVWAWGKNDHGQVGVPQGEDCPYHPRPCVQVPVAVPGLSGIKALAAAEDSSFALDAAGSVWAWGDNGKGQLGTESGEDRVSPVRVTGVSDIVSLSTANARVVALRGDGTVWTWGGSLEQATPAQVSGLQDMEAVAAGDARDLALGADGRVWAWDASGHPTPAVVAGLGPVTALAGGRLLSGAVAADGTVWTWGLSMSGTPEPPTRIEALGDIVAITIGVDSNVALRADGTVWQWQPYGQPRPIPEPALGTPTA